MYLTNYFETEILNLLRGVPIAAPIKMYIGIFLSNPGESGVAGQEVAYQGYSRQEIIFSAPAAMENGVGIQNIADITFPISETNVGTATHIGVLDSVTGGNMYLYGEFTEALNIQAGEAPVVVSGEAQWWLHGDMSVAYKQKVMNVLRGTNCAGFTPYFSLYNGNPDSGGSELSGASYARVALAFSVPEEQESGQMLTSNSEAARTARATETWGTWTYTVIMDAISSGLPFVAQQRTSKEMRKGLLASLAVGSQRITVN